MRLFGKLLNLGKTFNLSFGNLSQYYADRPFVLGKESKWRTMC